ncbi:ABC transporter permease [Rhizocola hellebori]|uniref:Oligopeptide transport system permease protein OppC n=1 Tax=Rhizocola hellebori TaxID=1392758 RepID=A0A8J3QJP7_9ACTN|nr:ABC transporter permease [Rhizocola hellebori]GIH10897.1 ABC transporter permease [Rhizocola hellebori]
MTDQLEVTPATKAPETGGFGVRERTQTEIVVRRFLRHKLAVGSLVLLILIVIIAYGGAALWKYDLHSTPDISQPPSWEHPFGTDGPGHDWLARVLRGLQQSIKIALSVALIGTVLGTIWGSIAGYFGRHVDNALMRLADLVIILPGIAVAATLASLGEGTWWMIAVIIGGLASANVSRLIRGVVLSLREQDFIEAAKALGASDTRIILRHLVPNALGPTIVSATILVAVGILAETGLSFLGFGVQSPDTSLGLLVQEAAGAVNTRPWLFYFPGLFIILIALTINFIGDGLRDAFDPKQTRVRQ